MMVPKALYEMLPHTYVAVGAAAVVGLPHAGQASGLLLLACGVVISRMRLNYRVDSAQVTGYRQGRNATNR